MKFRLNLGCGLDWRRGYLNVDNGSAECTADMRWDLNKRPWPWVGGIAEEVLMWHVLEHIPDTYAVMSEVHRVLAPGGRFWGQVPFALAETGMIHPQHCRYFLPRSFDTLANDFKMRLTIVRPVVFKTTWVHRLRNMVPGRGLLWRMGMFNAYDAIDFEMVKI